VLLELDVAASGDVTGRSPSENDSSVRRSSGRPRWLAIRTRREIQEDQTTAVAVDSKVLVVGFFRPPTFTTPARASTQGRSSARPRLPSYVDGGRALLSDDLLHMSQTVDRGGNWCAKARSRRSR
jgi:hypothetical protein